MLTISAKSRIPGQKLASLRKTGKIPAVFYGQGKKSVPIFIENKDFIKIRKAGETTPIVLKTETGNFDAIVQEIQHDPITLSPIHIDFLAIDVNKTVKAKIPLEFVGVSEAVKSGLGTLVKALHEIEVEALPKDLPHSISIDISPLKTLEDHIFVKDLSLPAGIKIISSPNEIIASVAAIKKEEEAVTVPPDLSSIEVIKKGKKEEEGEGEKAETKPEK